MSRAPGSVPVPVTYLLKSLFFSFMPFGIAARKKLDRKEVCFELIIDDITLRQGIFISVYITGKLGTYLYMETIKFHDIRCD